MRLSPKLLIIAALLSVTAGLTLLDQNHSETYEPLPPKIGAKASPALAPQVTFTLLDGSKLPLYTLQGHPVLLHFWASWCAPCKAEFRSLLANIAGRTDGTVMLAVSADTKAEDAERFLVPYRRDFKELFDDGRVRIAVDSDRKLIQDVFQTFQYPETIELGPDMSMQNKVVGIYNPHDL